MGKHVRKHYAVDKLPPEIKETIDEMIKADFTYREIVEYVKISGKSISVSAVQRYASNLMQTLQNIRITQENFRAIMDEISKHEDIDFTEPLTRLLCGQLLERINSFSDEQLREIGIDSVMKNAVALTRAVAYKRNVDFQNKSLLEKCFAEFDNLVFQAMADEKPALYAEVKKFVEKATEKIDK